MIYDSCILAVPDSMKVYYFSIGKYQRTYFRCLIFFFFFFKKKLQSQGPGLTVAHIGFIIIDKNII